MANFPNQKHQSPLCKKHESQVQYANNFRIPCRNYSQIHERLIQLCFNRLLTEPFNRLCQCSYLFYKQKLRYSKKLEAISRFPGFRYPLITSAIAPSFRNSPSNCSAALPIGAKQQDNSKSVKYDCASNCLAFTCKNKRPVEASRSHTRINPNAKTKSHTELFVSTATHF